MQLKKLPLGIQTFSEIRQQNYLYIDKTHYIYHLATGGKAFFLSRPRRFGKSLLVSTLYSLFKGEKELFKGLWIYDKLEFQEYPIIKLDFSGIDITMSDDLKTYIINTLERIAENNNVTLPQSLSYTEMLYELIVGVSKKNKVVVLVDEYDKPIIDYLTDQDKAIGNREILRQFYTVLKKADEYLRFIFLTGVSKFSKTSLFSGLNNLRDITIEDQFAPLLGYTSDEMESYFSEYVGFLAEKMGLSRMALWSHIEEWYNGYSWNAQTRVYNPFSVLSLFIKGHFDNYWFATGTPTFLINLFMKEEYNVPQLEGLIAGSELLESFDIERLTIESLLFQTGYLTIKEVIADDLRQYYKLGYPDKEVKESLLNYLAAGYLNKSAGLTDIEFLNMRHDLEKSDITSFFEKLQGLLSGIPYNIIVEKEAYYSSLLYIILALVGIQAGFEVQTATGRLDALIEIKDKVYIFEFKYDKPAQEALDQILIRAYADKYRGSHKEIILIGVGFHRKEKHIEYKVHKV